jgi:hypothetical protein
MTEQNWEKRYPYSDDGSTRTAVSLDLALFIRSTAKAINAEKAGAAAGSAVAALTEYSERDLDVLDRFIAGLQRRKLEEDAAAEVSGALPQQKPPSHGPRASVLSPTAGATAGSGSSLLAAPGSKAAAGESKQRAGAGFTMLAVDPIVKAIRRASASDVEALIRANGGKTKEDTAAYLNRVDRNGQSAYAPFNPSFDSFSSLFL